jgi:hypothetical protein
MGLFNKNSQELFNLINTGSAIITTTNISKRRSKSTIKTLKPVVMNHVNRQNIIETTSNDDLSIQDLRSLKLEESRSKNLQFRYTKPNKPIL